jgi:hypothetical protein
MPSQGQATPRGISVSSAAELLAATPHRVPAIEIERELRGMPMNTPGPGERVRGGTLQFGAKGVRLVRHSIVEDATIRTAVHEVAIINDTGVSDFGTLTLRTAHRAQVSVVSNDARSRERTGSHRRFDSTRYRRRRDRGRLAAYPAKWRDRQAR